MLLKLGVSLEKLRPEIRKKLTAIDAAYKKISGEEAVVTSTFEGTHSPGSLHYANLAIDIRRPGITVLIREALEGCLGPDFDIVFENDHVHIEYDPNPKKEVTPQ